ncbi:hypothetical protein Peur_044193 [Populus x canadensis]
MIAQLSRAKVSQTSLQISYLHVNSSKATLPSNAGTWEKGGKSKKHWNVSVAVVRNDSWRVGPDEVDNTFSQYLIVAVVVDDDDVKPLKTATSTKELNPHLNYIGICFLELLFLHHEFKEILNFYKVSRFNLVSRFNSDQWCALLVIFNIAVRGKILGTSRVRLEMDVLVLFASAFS